MSPSASLDKVYKLAVQGVLTSEKMGAVHGKTRLNFKLSVISPASKHLHLEMEVKCLYDCVHSSN